MSPLDRKSLPPDQQKKLTLVISSDDRDKPVGDQKGEDTDPADCTVTLNSGIKNAYAYRVIQTSVRNGFYSVQTGLNDILSVTWGTPPTTGDSNVDAGTITIPQGYYTFSVDPRDFANPFLVTPLNLNDIKIADLASLVANYGADVRVALLSAALGTIIRIRTSTVTRILTIDWFAGLLPTINLAKTTSMSLFGLDRHSSGTPWNGIRMPNVNGPDDVAFKSSFLNNNELIDPEGPNEFFQHITLTTGFGERQTFIPQNPPIVTFNGQLNWTILPIALVDNDSKMVLRGNDVWWQVTFEIYTLESNPLM